MSSSVPLRASQVATRWASCARGLKEMRDAGAATI
jgi:hypothetical protein